MARGRSYAAWHLVEGAGLVTDASPLERQISQWREYLRRRATLHGADVEELEDHLRSQVATLREQGLSDEEAFLVAVKRMGNLDALSREFAREHSERLWKQLVVAADEEPGNLHREAWMVALLAFAAAVAVKLPVLLGIRMESPEELFYFRNAGLFVLPLLTGYFAWKRRLGLIACVWLVLAFLLAAAFANLYPFEPLGGTQILTMIHLPIALWLAVGVAYVGGQWFASDGRMNFVRFTGELFIYYVLIALGGGVLTAFTIMMFAAIGLRAEEVVFTWLVPCGAAGAVIVASWLVEAKQGVIENMAPVLTRLFTPLFTAVLLVFLATTLWTGKPLDVQRDLLIAFDLLLVLVVALVLYTVSARDPRAPPGFFDRLQLALIVSAVLVDALALASIAGRIGEYGLTPNRVAALGENFILLVNLAGSAWFQLRFLRGREDFSSFERWQMHFLPVYCAWAALVVIVFPPVFGYR
jgi:hypothetical protein